MFVSQAIVERATLEAARFVQTRLDVVLTHRAAEVRAAGGVFVLHDWRAVKAYEVEARQYYLERMRSRPSDYLRHSVAAVSISPLVRMAVQMGNLAASLTARAQVELTSDPAAALVRHGVAPPATGERFPGRDGSARTARPRRPSGSSCEPPTRSAAASRDYPRTAGARARPGDDRTPQRRGGLRPPPGGTPAWPRPA